MAEKKLDEYNPTYDLYQAYINDKENYGIRLYFNNENDSYIVPGINILAGQTGHGKSMVANSIAYRSVRDGKNVLFVSLEISKKNIYYQMLSIHSYCNKSSLEAISHSDIKRHNLNGKQEQFAFTTLWPEFQNLKGNLYIVDEWDFDVTSINSLQEIFMLVEEYAQVHTGKGLDLIIIDYVQLFKVHKEALIRNEYEALSRWANDLRRITTNFLGQNRMITMLLVSQLNRDAMTDVHDLEKRKAKNSVLPADKQKGLPDIKIGMSQIAGSIELCKHASTIYAIYSDGSYRSSKQCKIFMLKNRDGACNEDGILTFMDPKYYSVGHFNSCETVFVGSYEDIVGGISINTESILL